MCTDRLVAIVKSANLYENKVLRVTNNCYACGKWSELVKILIFYLDITMLIIVKMFLFDVVILDL